MQNERDDFRFADEWGPEYIIKTHDPVTGAKGILVVHNTALGPGKGGIRMTPDISEEEVYRLARTMTWKNALAGIPFGGAKAGIRFQPGTDNKQAFIESFARSIKPLLIKKYIGGPDVNTGEREMQQFAEAVNNWRSVTGKPADYCADGVGGKKCGLPHELGSTGFGVAQATKVAAAIAGMDLKGATVGIHGFGNVGTFAYQFLTEMGAKVVAIADRSGAVYSESGFDGGEMKLCIDDKKLLRECSSAQVVSSSQFWGLPMDILIPASVTDVINDSNKAAIKAKIIVEAGNIPMREHVEEEFVQRGTLIVPDFVANAGGVISSYAEHRGYSSSKMFAIVEQKITRATKAVLSTALKSGRNPRTVALDIAQERVRKAMARRAGR